MSRVNSLSLLAAIIVSICAVAGLMSPQVRLCARVATSHFSPPVAVSAFCRCDLDGTAVPVQLGVLSFRVPRAMYDPLRDRRPQEELTLLCAQREDLGILVPKPLPNGLIDLRRELGMDTGVSPHRDEVQLEAAAFAADPRRASPLMSSEQASQLDALLTVRTFLVGGIQQVEVLYGDGIKGLLLTRDIGNNRVAMIFNYFSADESLSGTAILTVDARDGHAMKTARGIISSFRMAAP